MRLARYQRTPGVPSIENPEAIWLAYQYAIRSAPTRAAARRMVAASHRWADTPSSGTLSEIGSAIRAAESCGVGGLFLSAVGEVAENTAISQAEVQTQQPATAEDESFVNYVMTKVRAAPETAANMLQWSVDHSPSVVAQRAATDAIVSYTNAVQEAAKKSVDEAKGRAQAALDSLEAKLAAAKKTVDESIRAGANVALLTGAGLMLLAVVLWKSL